MFFRLTKNQEVCKISKNMTYEEFKKMVVEKAREKLNPLDNEAFVRLKQELKKAKTYYEELGDLYSDLMNKPVTSNAFVIPWLLERTEKMDFNEPMPIVQSKAGATGGVDVDSDLSGKGRDTIITYLKSKYGEDCVTPVGTISTLQMKVACKDLLRYASCPVADSNTFTASLDDELSFEDNVKEIIRKGENNESYRIYIKYQKFLDLVPRFLGKARNVGKHAGGVVLTPKPIWNYCPVERSDKTIVTAFPESGQFQYLDEIGLVKLDILAISVLDVIDETVSLINEELFLIEEDGMQKIVPKSYILERQKAGEKIEI